MSTARTERITATPAARAAISRLRVARGAPVMFVQSGGCCAGSTPMCLPEGELVVGAQDVLLGEIDGCPFYIDEALDAAWRRGRHVLDVARGEPEGFSLPAGDGLRFVTTPADVTASSGAGGAAPCASTERSTP